LERRDMNYWILQCNPRTYHIFNYWRDHPTEIDGWAVSRYENEIKAGDVAFIWVANNPKTHLERGIYARAIVVACPDGNRPPFATETNYWLDKHEERRLVKLPRLELSYTKVPLDKPLTASKLKGIPALQGLQILRMPQRSVYKLSNNEGRIIESLVEQMS
jgi:predicted RNA-binding protein with PUA-like domain